MDEYKEMMKPIPGNSYIMRPNFTENASQIKRLTRVINVLKVGNHWVEKDFVEFAEIQELVKGPEVVFGLLWDRGDRSLRELNKYDFIPLSEEHLTHKCQVVREIVKQKLQEKEKRIHKREFIKENLLKES